VVEARDLGSPPLQNTKTLTVQLIDVNDNKPAFPQETGQGKLLFYKIKNLTDKKIQRKTTICKKCLHQKLILIKLHCI